VLGFGIWMTLKTRAGPSLHRRLGVTMDVVESKSDESGALAELVDRLVAQFPEVPSDSVRAIVNASWEEFTGRPIRDFVPVLAERTARHRLSSKTSAG